MRQRAQSWDHRHPLDTQRKRRIEDERSGLQHVRQRDRTVFRIRWISANVIRRNGFDIRWVGCDAISGAGRECSVVRANRRTNRVSVPRVRAALPTIIAPGANERVSRRVAWRHAPLTPVHSAKITPAGIRCTIVSFPLAKRVVLSRHPIADLTQFVGTGRRRRSCLTPATGSCKNSPVKRRAPPAGLCEAVRTGRHAPP